MLFIDMKKLFENWRRYVNESETTRGGRSLPYSDEEYGSTIGGQSLDVSPGSKRPPDPQKPPVQEPEKEDVVDIERCEDGSRPPCVKPFIYVMDKFEVTPDLYIDTIRAEHPEASKEFSDNKLRQMYYNLSKQRQYEIKTKIKDYLKTQNTGIDIDNIVFTGL